MDDKTKVTAAIEQLKQLGFKYNTNAQNIIEECDQWYTNEETDFHTRKNLNGQEIKLDKLNFAKRCCADDANLCEIVEINAGESENKFDGVPGDPGRQPLRCDVPQTAGAPERFRHGGRLHPT